VKLIAVLASPAAAVSSATSSRISICTAFHETHAAKPNLRFGSPVITNSKKQKRRKELTIRSQLCLLPGQLGLTRRIPLRDFDLDSQNIGLKLEDLVLYLAILKRLSSGGTCACSSNSIVEAAGVDFSIFTDLGSFGNNGKIRCSDTCEIGLVDLCGVR
jgi:hypothetical protein